MSIRLKFDRNENGIPVEADFFPKAGEDQVRFGTNLYRVIEINKQEGWVLVDPTPIDE